MERRRQYLRLTIDVERILVASSLLFVFLACSVGCGDSKSLASGKYIPPDSFSDDDGQWVKETGEMTDSDNERIGQFFDSNPDLIDSPDWHGQPEKYVMDSSSDQIRYYWFGGNVDSPTWNVVEFEGWSFREFEGQGRLTAPDMN